MSDNTTRDAVVIERIFDAPQDLVWTLWTDPDHFKNWYGPTGFSIPVAEMDVQVGGKRRVCMASPDGSMTMWTTGKFTVVDPTDKLAYTESISDKDDNIISQDGVPDVTEVTVLLEAMDNRTKMTLTHAGIPADSPGKSGWEMAFDKLDAQIKAIQEGE